MGQTFDAIITDGSCASFAFMFDEGYAFEAGRTITQQHPLVIANGSWDAT